MAYSLQLTNEANTQDEKAVFDGLLAFNVQYVGPDNYQPLNIYLRDESGTIVGGLLGITFWGWLFVSILWVSEALRGQDYGSTMIKMAEAEAVQRGCKNVYLDTLSFQALDFYRKLGYSVYGQLANFPEGHTRYFLTKPLDHDLG